MEDDPHSPGLEATSPVVGRRVEAAPRAELAPGATLGHFVIDRRLGGGGMGVVYAAHDPMLDRLVAIKVIRPDLGVDPEMLRARLLREAQTLSRVIHPNVVTVHEAGVVGDQLFIAMEHVEAGTLSAWLAARRRGWREIVPMFLQAGRGLCAVHRAGLVHRDFKPANVLVGKDGRVRVTDFGVAAFVGAREGGGADAGAPAGSLTATGVLLGTPRYMAPEQHDGGRVDARADQFAFAVSLHEALAGEPPFAGDTVGELREQIRAGAVRPLPDGVPRWLARIVRRGLRPDPGGRYPSLDALLHALERGPALTPRRAAAGAAVLAAAAAAILGAQALRREPPCRGAERRLAGVWDPPVRAAVEKAFLAGGGRPAFDRLAARLDGYAASWTAMRVEACEATAVRGEQSAALLDLRMACLDRRLGELAALTSLAQSPAHAGDGAVVSAHRLTPVAGCGDRAALAAGAPPVSAELRPEVDALRGRLARAQTLERMGNLGAAEAEVTPLVADARRLGYAPLLAETLLLRGRIIIDKAPAEVEATLEEAVALAADAKDDELTAQGLIALLRSVGGLQERFAEAKAMGPAIDAAIRRAGNSDGLRASYLETMAVILQARGQYAEGIDLLQQAVKLSEKAHGESSLPTARVLGTLVGSLIRADRWDEARAPAERALAIVEATLGPDAADVGTILARLGILAQHAGDFATARRYYERNLALKERHKGPRSDAVATQIYNLARLASDEGNMQEARRLYERSLAIRLELYGPDHPDVAVTKAMLGDVFRELGDLERAGALLEEALRAQEKRQGPDHPDLGYTLDRLAHVRRLQKRLPQAIALVERSVAIRRKAYGDDHPMTEQTVSYLGDVYLQAGRAADALRALEEAAAMKHQPDAAEAARSRFLLARALRAAHRDPARALSLAREARAQLVAAGGKETVAEIDRFLSAVR